MQSENKTFLFDELEASFSLLDFDDYRVGIFLSRNKDKTTQENEDVVYISYDKTGLLLGVADGAGGHPRGRDAANLIGSTILDYSDDNYTALIENINNKIIDLKVGAKSTLAFVSIKNETANFYSVGDSEIIYWNAHGNEVFTSTPHSNSGLKVRAGVTTQAEALSDPDRNLVNNLMGDEFIKIESTTGISIKKGHTILIGTDGLFDNLSHEQLTEIVGKGSFDKSFEELANICSVQDSETWLKNDDIGFVIIRKMKA